MNVLVQININSQLKTFNPKTLTDYNIPQHIQTCLETVWTRARRPNILPNETLRKQGFNVHPLMNLQIYIRNKQRIFKLFNVTTFVAQHNYNNKQNDIAVNMITTIEISTWHNTSSIGHQCTPMYTEKP